MTEAEEMLKECGYEKASYMSGEFYRDVARSYRNICFNNRNKDLSISCFHIPKSQNFKLIEAIYKRMKELGWEE